MKRMSAFLGLALLMACSPGAADKSATAATAAGAPVRHPESGLAVIPLTITTKASRILASSHS